MDFLENQGGGNHIGSVQEVKMGGDVGQSIPQIYASLDNREVENQETIIEKYYKLSDQVFSL